MGSDDLERRKLLSFAEAEGVVPLPMQLQRDAMPKVLRARLWEIFYGAIKLSTSKHSGMLFDPWLTILSDIYVHKYGVFPNKLPATASRFTDAVENIFEVGKYVAVYTFIQHVLRHPRCPDRMCGLINAVLTQERAAYRVLDTDTLVPVGSDEEIKAISSAIAVSKADGFEGANRHLKNAGSNLSAGAFADSVRESIHAVEAVARTMEPSGELSRSLAMLENSIGLHAAMKKGFCAIYGYASDEDGIRHPLLEGGDARVDESDALFMMGACASFVTYLISKKRIANLPILAP